MKFEAVLLHIFGDVFAAVAVAVAVAVVFCLSSLLETFRLEDHIFSRILILKK